MSFQQNGLGVQGLAFIKDAAQLVASFVVLQQALVSLIQNDLNIFMKRIFFLALFQIIRD